MVSSGLALGERTPLVRAFLAMILLIDVYVNVKQALPASSVLAKV